MADVIGTGAIRLVDSDGDPIDDGAGSLKVTLGTGASTLTTYPQFDAAAAGETLTEGLAVTAVTNCKEIILQADFDNTAYIMVGDGGVVADTEGIRLHAGDMLTLPISSTENVSVRGSTTSQNLNVAIIT
jgi:ethanolamine utilization protein EutQ (cupin superfamily)